MANNFTTCDATALIAAGCNYDSFLRHLESVKCVVRSIGDIFFAPFMFAQPDIMYQVFKRVKDSSGES